MVDVYILSTQVEGVSSEIVQLVNINPVDLVTDYLELPISCAVRLASD
jgi:hypothetical protein